MRNGFLASIAALLAGTGLVLGQTAPSAPAAPKAPPAPEQKKAEESATTPTMPSPALPAPEAVAGADHHGACCLPQEEGDTGSHYWVSAGFLLWWLKDYHVPALVTTGPATLPVGVLGNLGTSLLFGDERLDHQTFSGARLTAGGWLNDCKSLGLEGSVFFLGQRSEDRTFSSPVLARPFISQNTGAPFSVFAAFPNIATSAIKVSSPSQLWGWEANLRKNVTNGCPYCLDLLGGFRYLDLQETLTVAENALFSRTALFPALAGNEFLVTDRFGTRNQFYGAQVGADAYAAHGPWFLGVRTKVAFGATHEVVDIQGNQNVITPTGTRIVTGGLLALPTNIGRVTRDEFAVVPELGVNVGCQITPHLQAFIGYTFLYWSSVVRPGDQIDPVLDVNRIPNFGVPARPVAVSRPLNPFNEADLWVQGINFSVAVSW